MDPLSKFNAKLPTRKDVAKLAGVSVATVSYVLNNSPKQITRETREKVLDAVQQLNYKPNLIARSLKRGRSETICVVIPAFQYPGIPTAVEEITRGFEQHRYTVQIRLLDLKSTHHLKSYEDVFFGNPMDGYIVIGSLLQYEERMHRLSEGIVPIVQISGDSKNSNHDTVTPNCSKAGSIAVEYLYHQGCAVVWLIGIRDGIIDLEPFFEGGYRFLQDRGDPSARIEKVFLPQHSGILLESTLEAKVAAGTKPDGVIFCSGESARITWQSKINQTWSLSKRKQIVINPWMGEFIDSSIPQIRCDWTGVGRAAVELLVQRMKESQGDEKPTRVECDVELVLR